MSVTASIMSMSSSSLLSFRRKRPQHAFEIASPQKDLWTIHANRCVQKSMSPELVFFMQVGQPSIWEIFVKHGINKDMLTCLFISCADKNAYINTHPQRHGRAQKPLSLMPLNGTEKALCGFWLSWRHALVQKAEGLCGVMFRQYDDNSTTPHDHCANSHSSLYWISQPYNTVAWTVDHGDFAVSSASYIHVFKVWVIKSYEPSSKYKTKQKR